MRYRWSEETLKALNAQFLSCHVVYHFSELLAITPLYKWQLNEHYNTHFSSIQLQMLKKERANFSQ